MSESSSRGSWLGLLLLAGVGGSLWFAVRPLVSHRPSVEPSNRDIFSDHEHVPSRLWQDPFEALQRFRARDSNQPPGTLAEELTALAENRPLDVLLVALAGGQYPEDAESRLRSRRAVVAALALEEFSPVDPEHLGVAALPWGAMLGTSNHFSPDRLAPVDGFARKDTSNRVAVVWLAESLLGNERPLDRLEALAAHISTARAARHITFVGPRTSGALKAMLDQCTTVTNTPPAWPGLTNVAFYSSWATADDALLIEDDRFEKGIRRAASAWFGTHALRFENFVHTDRELSRALVRELRNRGHRWPNSATNRHDAVVIIAEHDTAYGRGLPVSFTAEALSINQPGATHEELIRQARARQHEHPAGIHRFGYLRGTDGEQPVATEFAQEDLSKARREAMAKLEQPEGPGQLDYLRRLARALDDLNRHGQVRSIKAIGVLGSDFYDKTLVLQALRPVFPEAVFFTTDLDARMTHSSHLRWTRNLVVASSRGLQPADVEGIAGFREAYQTTLFEAVRAAVNRRPAPELPPVRLFEIGRTRAVPLSLPRDRYDAVTTTNAQISPWHRKGLEVFVLSALSVFLVWYLFPQWIARLAAMVEGLLVSEPRRREDFIRNRTARGFLIFLVAVFVAFPVFITVQSAMPGGEPLYLFEGVSVWPSELIRLLTFLVGSLCFLRARDALRENKRRLNRDFDLPARVDSLQRVKHWWRRRLEAAGTGPGNPGNALAAAWTYRRRVARDALMRWTRMSPCTVRALGNGRTRMEGFWEDYNALGYSLNRVIRVLGSMLLFAGIAFTMVWIYEPPAVPYRGEHLFLSDSLPLILAVVTQVFLTFFVLDAALLCRTMIKGLTHPRIRWKKSTCQKYGERFKLEPWLMEEWLDIQLISRRTTVIMPLIYYPFITLFLLICARSSLFDNWTWPWALLVIVSLITLFALGAVWIVRGSAELARRTSLEGMQRKLLRLMASLDTDGEATDRYRELIKEVAECRLGAFAPLAEQPLLKAVAVPFGGAGLLAMIEVFAFL